MTYKTAIFFTLLIAFGEFSSLVESRKEVFCHLYIQIVFSPSYAHIFKEYLYNLYRLLQIFR